VKFYDEISRISMITGLRTVCKYNIKVLCIELSLLLWFVFQEEFEDTKGRSSESVYRRRTDNTIHFTIHFIYYIVCLQIYS
jgi:hypothetical protein